MKKIKFKQNIPIIIFNILIVILFSSMFLRHYFFENGAKNIMYARERYNACVELVNADENERESMIEKYEEEYGFLLEIEECEKLASFENPPKSAVNLYLDIVSRNDFSNYIIPYFVPLLILFPFIYKLSKEFKSKYIKSYILRDGYKNYVKNIFKQAYSNIWVVPLMFFILALISYLIAGHVDTSADNYLNYLIAPVELFFKPSFYISYFLVILLNFGWYTNVGLFVLSKNKNFIVAFIESFLIVYMIWCFNDIFMISFLGNLFKVNYVNFSMLNIYTCWNYLDSILLYVLYNLIIYVISLIIVVRRYKNKESIMQNCEK